VFVTHRESCTKQKYQKLSRNRAGHDKRDSMVLYYKGREEKEDAEADQLQMAFVDLRVL